MQGHYRLARGRRRKGCPPEVPAPGTAVKAEGLAPKRCTCTLEGCERTTTGVWAAYQHLAAVHSKGDASEAETKT